MEIVNEMRKLAKGFDSPTIAVVGSHSALDVCAGARKYGIKNLVICQKGRERPYDLHYKRKGNVGCVDETLILSKFAELCNDANVKLLQKKQAILVPHRSLCVYVGYDALEKCPVPIFGNRFLLKAEERNVPNNQRDLLVKAGLNVPKLYVADEIDGLAIVKASEAKRSYERAFFFVSSPEEYEKKSREMIARGIITRQGLETAIIEEYVVGVPFNFNFFYSPLAHRLELVGIDIRRQTNLDGVLRLPADEQLEVLKRIRVRNIEAGHVACTIRESILETVFDMGEKFIETCRKEYPSGILGPFALQSLLANSEDGEKMYIYDVSFRMPGSPGIKCTPYGNYLYGESLNMGERVAMEVKEALKQNALDKLVT